MTWSFKWPQKMFKKKLPANPRFLCSPRLRLVKGGLCSIVEVVQVWIQMLHLTSPSKKMAVFKMEKMDELQEIPYFGEKKTQATQDENPRWEDIHFFKLVVFSLIGDRFFVTLLRHKWPGLQVPHTEGLYSAALIDLHLKVLVTKSFGARKKEIKI